MPDVVVAVNGVPIVAIEQTQMNPSGHNIPQRFSFQVRAAEVGIPSILYYPEYARRTFSDPNVRYPQVRVPLAQKRLSRIFDTAALSVFWPTNPDNQLPDVRQNAHRSMANLVNALVSNAANPEPVVNLPEIRAALAEMDRVIATYSGRYRRNGSVRKLVPQGFPSATASSGVSVDPPNAAHLFRTSKFIDELAHLKREPSWAEVESRLGTREFTLRLAATANKARNDSEHPWPGYLTLLDILYLRTDTGRTALERSANLAYRLPIPMARFLSRANDSQPPTATHIVDTFADVIVLNDGVVAGKPIRGNAPAQACLSE